MKALLPLALLTLAPALSLAAPTIWSANDHAYEVITLATGTGTYSAAKTAAEAMTFMGVPGRLLVLDTADYSAERDFVAGLFNATSPGTAYWVGVTRAPQAGAKTENWLWDDGTAVPTSITSGWQLDGAEGQFASTDYAGIFFSNDSHTNVWDYIKTDTANFSGGYVVEFASPVPEPATMAALGLGALALLRRRRA